MKNKKILGLGLSAVLALGMLSGCGTKTDTGNKSAASPTPVASPTTSPSTTSTPAATSKPPADATTTASIVRDEDAFLKAISKDGTWIIAILRDMNIPKELVVEGTFKNGKKDAQGNELFQRKIALYTQDDKRNVTARFTLTAPKITFKSPYGSLEHGTFKGDVYVEGKNFKLVDQKIEGNLYFLNDEAKSTFTKDDKSTVTGVTELKK